MSANFDFDVEPDPRVIAELEAIEREEEGLPGISIEEAFQQARRCVTDLQSLDALQATSKE